MRTYSVVSFCWFCFIFSFLTILSSLIINQHYCWVWVWTVHILKFVPKNWREGSITMAHDPRSCSFCPPEGEVSAADGLSAHILLVRCYLYLCQTALCAGILGLWPPVWWILLVSFYLYALSSPYFTAQKPAISDIIKMLEGEKIQVVTAHWELLFIFFGFLLLPPVVLWMKRQDLNTAPPN